MTAAAWTTNPLTTDIDDRPPWLDDMTNQGNHVLCEEAGPSQAPHQPKHHQLHITEDLTSDEKSQIQALDRTQPSLPMKKGRAGTMTHDYKRNGTTTLFAALDVLSGVVIGQCLPRHTNNEFLHFLKKVDREVPKGVAVHVVLDNYGTHNHPNVRAWLAKHPRFHFHFTPTSSSWLNLVERWFRDLTDKAIRRGVFRSVPDLIAAIEAYLAAHNKDPKPFIWTASADEILEKVRRGRVALGRITA